MGERGESPVRELRDSVQFATSHSLKNSSNSSSPPELVSRKIQKFFHEKCTETKLACNWSKFTLRIRILLQSARNGKTAKQSSSGWN